VPLDERVWRHLTEVIQPAMLNEIVPCQRFVLRPRVLTLAVIEVLILIVP
jgi:hypothetical protein